MGFIADIAGRTDHVALVEADWRDPVSVASAFADEPFALVLLSDGERGRWSYVLRRPVRTLALGADRAGDGWSEAAQMLGRPTPGRTGGPPFQGGIAGLAGYEMGARGEPTAPQARAPGWPDLVAGLYLGLLAFDHHERRVLAIGRGDDEAAALRRADVALAWLHAPEAAPAQGPLAEAFGPLEADADYGRAVVAVTDVIAAGEIFQANVARTWAGTLRPEARPFDLFHRLAGASPAPFAAYLRLEGRAVVSNSPERFVSVSAGGVAATQPIKGTRPRAADAAADAALAAELLASGKDQAENLMIVDLMRNDLARVCVPGSVKGGPLFALESYANVHHLVSTVVGRLAPGRGAFDLMAAAFPPGSITGAPKVQAMRVIARHEPPRGPYCGSMFWAGFDGAFDSSVLIRTAAFERQAEEWRFEARAGAGIVADSDPDAETQETWAKIAALRAALTEAP